MKFAPKKFSPRQVDRVVNKTRRQSSLLTTVTTFDAPRLFSARSSIVIKSLTLASAPPGMPGTHPRIFGWGTSTRISPKYYYVLSDIADQYWLPSVRSASSRFHSAIRRHQLASVRQADSRLTRLVPPTLNSRWRHWSLSPLLRFVVNLLYNLFLWYSNWQDFDWHTRRAGHLRGPSSLIFLSPIWRNRQFSR